jgi:hypothetical protein
MVAVAEGPGTRRFYLSKIDNGIDLLANAERRGG